MKASEQTLRQSAASWNLSSNRGSVPEEIKVRVDATGAPLIKLLSPDGVHYASMNGVTGERQIHDKHVYARELSRFLRDAAGQHDPH